MTDDSSQVAVWMQHAIDLAEKGRGYVEPNPMVGCLIIRNGSIIGAGFHEQFGRSHAEVNALDHCSESPIGATAVITLEPCCHQGKTPPCTDALIQAGISKVIIGHPDPFPKVNGSGIEQLKGAGIEVQMGPLQSAIARQNSGFFKRVTQKIPWCIAKWAMTLDGNIATQTGDSQWISNPACRKIVHQLRGQMDAVIVGSGTACTDDPSLSARPAGARRATRIVFDSKGTLDVQSKLCQSARDIPVLVVVDPRQANQNRLAELKKNGVNIFECEAGYVDRVPMVLNQLGELDMTNVLLEGGGRLLGEFFEANSIDEAHVFIAPTLIGSGQEPIQTQTPGAAADQIAKGKHLKDVVIQQVDGNVHVRGFV
ncbi:bifunctional diaminohydroxyphosphoribosylaminopyrimidine deaminase/5-amino-6-(5-phosphoribosylamino)uracil reductase RibD [Pirellulaceae bacterium]|nr:bifunctional diaminohydroxyphosphoribosylaminopyrimidine deaminase/5-amino-6-(5-phosphoribosylamino)uracil reductase RibD [Pirellulaceae bacterium]